MYSIRNAYIFAYRVIISTIVHYRKSVYHELFAGLEKRRQHRTVSIRSYMLCRAFTAEWLQKCDGPSAHAEDCICLWVVAVRTPLLLHQEWTLLSFIVTAALVWLHLLVFTIFFCLFLQVATWPFLGKLGCLRMQAAWFTCPHLCIIKTGWSNCSTSDELQPAPVLAGKAKFPLWSFDYCACNCQGCHDAMLRSCQKPPRGFFNYNITFIKWIWYVVTGKCR